MLQKNVSISATCILHNYFDGLMKLFSNLYRVKFLNISTEPFRMNYFLSIYLSIIPENHARGPS